MVRICLIICIIFTLASHGTSQDYKPLTLEDIYQNNTFQLNTVRAFRWMNDGSYYTSLKKNEITGFTDLLKYSTTTGQVVDTLIYGDQLITERGETPISIDKYQFNSDETKVLISSQHERIYRRSSKAINYIYDLKSRQLKLLVEGDKQSYATFSPDGTKVAFVRENNLFMVNIEDGNLSAVTTDGKKNQIINGFADWVYEEELSLSKVFYWAPDGSKLAYMRFDESKVPMYNMQKWNGLYPEDYTFKYPKAGETNSDVSLHVYDVASKKTIEVSIDNEKDIYIARAQWLPDGKSLSIIKLNRLQNKLQIYQGDPVSGKSKLIYTDIADTYIDIDQVDDLTYLSDGQSFIISSERSGYKHLYHYSIDGDLIRQITSGNWGVVDFSGIDEGKKLLYYRSNEISSIEKHIYVVDLKGKKSKRLSNKAGVHSVDFSSDFKYYTSTHSSSSSPPRTALFSHKGEEIKVLRENDDAITKGEAYGFGKIEFFRIAAANGDSLNCYMIKPTDFDNSKKYPLLMHTYGGPGSQRVMNQWSSVNGNLWHHYLTQQGYIVACVDNRGTGGKGRDFQHITYERLGKFESEDQINAAKHFATLPYIDEDRVGIWGWSYGGYLSSLSLLLGNDVFKAAISVAPVTNWRYYDTIYTERYLGKPQDNPDGYDQYSPKTHVEKLEGSLLLIHGTGDDNVHFQNAVEFQNALIKANKQFDSFYYPNRNHGIYGGNTRLHLYTMMSNFILEKL